MTVKQLGGKLKALFHRNNESKRNKSWSSKKKCFCCLAITCIIGTLISIAIAVLLAVLGHQVFLDLIENEASSNDKNQLRIAFNSCPENFTFNGNSNLCYKFVNGSLTMESAEKYCKNKFGARLPEPQNFFEYQQLLEISEYGMYFYLGAKRAGDG